MTRTIKTAALAMTIPGFLAAAAPASALPAVNPFASSIVTSAPAVQNGRENERDYRGYDDRPSYNDRGYYNQANAQSWRGDDGRTYCRKPNGTTGLLIGGVVGGLLGHEIAGRRGDRTLGVILGAAGGALVGRAVDRGGSRCR